MLDGPHRARSPRCDLTGIRLGHGHARADRAADAADGRRGDRRRGRAAAAAADVAVVVVGLTEEQETEAVDKSTLRLPGAQDELVAAVAAAARRTVVVVNAATPVLMPWLDEVDAVALGRAARPGGRPRRRGRAARRHRAGRPAGHHVPGRRRRGAGLVGHARPTARSPTPRAPFIGYRGHFAGPAPEPAFWFGHGLGYGDLGVRRRAPSRGDGRTVDGRRSPTPADATAARSCRSTSSPSATTSRCGWSAGRASTCPPASRSPRRSTGPADVAALGHRRPRLADPRPAASCWSPAVSATCATVPDAP